MLQNDASGQDTAAAESAMSKLKRLVGTPILTWDILVLKKRDWKTLFCIILILILLPQLMIWSTFMSARRDDDPKYLDLVLKEETDCDTVHLASICGGYYATRDFYVLLKSILFHRRSYRIQYHIFVDEISSKILTGLFETWQVPDLDISFYNISQYEPEVSWITNNHYSSNYGLLKLLVPSILTKKNLTQVILLDTDMLVLGDIRQIWNNFSRLSWSSFLGLVENQSDWYLTKKDSSSSLGRSNVWPAVGRGYNTGLILIDIKKAIEQDWDNMWREVAATELVELLYTSLADQDVYNAVIKKHSRIATKLPCNLNLQLNNHTNLNQVCSGYEVEAISVVHWNSPSKLKVANEKADYFRNWYQTFQDWNGKLLERNGCPKAKQEYPDLNNSSSISNPCLAFHPQPVEKLRTLLYTRGFELNESNKDFANISITAVVHLTTDRLHSLEDLAARWSGPISAAIYLNDAETSILLYTIEHSEVLSKRANIGYHLVFKVIGWHYPINRMRNIALDNVLTPYVFLIDVDFLPTRNLYRYLQETISNMSQNLKMKALVIPAFESRQYRLEFPENKTDLIVQLNLGKVTTFRSQEWPQGQLQTDYPRWKRATRPYRVSWRQDYEPYIVTTKDVRKFDERFIGFGWNKVEHSILLAAEGYEFVVLPDTFIIHQNHAASIDLIAFRNDKNFHMCIEHLKWDVRRSVLEKYDSLYHQQLS